MARAASASNGLLSGATRRARLAARWLGARLLNLVYPPRCIHCGVDLSTEDDRPSLCPTCDQMLGPERWPGCRRCGALLTADTPTNGQCHNCHSHRLLFDGVAPLGAYEGELRHVVLKMKRSSYEPLSVAMGRLLVERRSALLAQFRPSVIVPIPMHWRRRLWRGVNSPEVLARTMGRELHVPSLCRALVRCRSTMPQYNLQPHERFVNVRGAFRLRGRNRALWKDSHVLLVDDILTTGATCSEAARMLKEAGAATVAVAVVAKAQGSHDS